MQRFAKFKKILWSGFRATLNFRSRDELPAWIAYTFHLIAAPYYIFWQPDDRFRVESIKTILSDDKHDKMQRFAKFKKILWSGFRTTLNFRSREEPPAWITYTFHLIAAPYYIFWQPDDRFRVESIKTILSDAVFARWRRRAKRLKSPSREESREV